MAGLRSIPSDIYEQFLDRTGSKTVTYKLVHYDSHDEDIIVINTVLIITGGFKIFETVQQLTNGGPNHVSDVLVTYMYHTTFTTSRYGYGMAIATVSFIFCLIFSIIYLTKVNKSMHQEEG